MREKRLPDWPPVRVLEEDGKLWAVVDNRRLYISRIAWRHGIVGFLSVVILRPGGVDVKRNLPTLSSSATFGVGVGIQPSNETPGPFTHLPLPHTGTLQHRRGGTSTHR